MTSIRIGTRGSALALAQTNTIAAKLADASTTVEIVVVTTKGDTSTESLSALGGTGVFASALRDALLAGECDVVVHSLKDLPTAQPDGLVIAAIPARADARDALVARDDLTLDTLPPGSRVGTGSPRRTAQLRSRRPDLDVVDIRGNVDTRIGKVTGGELDAVVLAAAGLERLGRLDAATDLIGIDGWPTAPGQGALAIEVRAGEESRVKKLDHARTRTVVEAERTLLALLEAGCAAPVAANAFVDDGLLFLTASVYSLDGTKRLTASHALYVADSKSPAADVAERVATELLAGGAADLAPLKGSR
ncbi:MAG: hydroxymethylbilane synthase [Rhodoglobus sp.]